MTDQDRETREASQQADEALQAAERRARRSAQIAKAWARSRNENNFRLMIRGLGQRASENGT